MEKNTTVNKHEKKLQDAQRAIQSLKKKVSQHPWYLSYHVAPPANWMNDPNGFCFYKGEAHLFYQHYPYTPEWGPMHWGHVKSQDLVFWEHLPVALAPGEEYDVDGCFSGSAIEKDGKLYLMYTGHVLTGPDSDEDLKQTQALAVSEDGIKFKKITQNPVISHTPDGDIHPAHFRDPKVWKHEEMYYVVIGSKTKANTGQVLLYRSPDLMNWEFVNVMAKATGNFGFMWECPDLFNLNGKDVLVMSPQGMKPEGDLYHNIHQAGYVIGNLDYDTGLLSYGAFQLLDFGFDFYAPQTMVDDKGRRILIAWMSMWEDQMPTKEFGWAGAMTLPRVVEMQGDRLITKPVPELKELRENEVSYNRKIVDKELSLEGVSGDCVELEMLIDMKKATQFSLKMRMNELEKEETVLRYDVNNSRLTLDRNQSGQGEGGIRNVNLDLKENKIHLNIFIDKSSVEVFVNGGEQVITSRIFPNEKSKDICFLSEGEVELVYLNKWDLKRAIK